jgi:hypothetical protein
MIFGSVYKSWKWNREKCNRTSAVDQVQNDMRCFRKNVRKMGGKFSPQRDLLCFEKSEMKKIKWR